MEANSLKIKSIIENFLRTMDFGGEVAVGGSDENFLRVDIQSPEAAYLIGRGGETLAALQHLARCVVSKEIGQPLSFIIDVNGYQRDRLDLLKEAAIDLAREAVLQRQPKWLAPMNAYERRTVHLALAGLGDVKTESEGQGSERRIVIKPIIQETPKDLNEKKQDGS